MKRRLFKLGVFLTLGAIVNVAVAWGCAVWMTTEPNPEEMDQDAAWRTLAERQLALKSSGTLDTIEFTSLWVTYTVITLDKTGLDNFQPDEADIFIYLFLVSAGVPMRSLIVEWRGMGKSVPEILDSFHLIGGLEVDRWVASNHGHPTALPINPLWPGFAINTIFYAAILWVMWMSPFTARRMIRHKRGHCLKCGYDLRGEFSSGCPECGWRREAKA